jgi:hypothetical protein
MAKDKIETILEWPKLDCTHDVQMILGFAIFFDNSSKYLTEK